MGEIIHKTYPFKRLQKYNEKEKIRRLLIEIIEGRSVKYKLASGNFLVLAGDVIFYVSLSYDRTIKK